MKKTAVIGVLLLASSSLGAAEIPCEYDSNSEWPQPEGKVCQSTDSPLLLADDATSASVTPVVPTCSSAAFDSDGDGWGWENQESCRVLLIAGNPVCENVSSDTDGDGWGWENGRSCIADAAFRVDSPVNLPTDSPVCELSSSDSDGDGWGWENGASCRVSGTVVDQGSATPVDQGTTTPVDQASSVPVDQGSVTPVDHPSCEYRASDDNADGWGFENGQSCRITSASKYPECYSGIEDTDGDGWGFQNNQVCQYVDRKEFEGVVFEQNFESVPLGSYGSGQLNKDWKTPIWHLGFTQGRVDVVPDPERGNAIRVTYPANKFGAAGAAAFLSDLKFAVDLPVSHEELYLSYDVKFAKDFDFVRGGKLPGLCGYDNSLSPTSGCNTGGGFPDGYDGWSARGMWRLSLIHI